MKPCTEPPYSIKTWIREAFAKDPYGRNLWGVPPQGRADYAFFQHIAQSLDPETGRAAILFPHGVLFRKDEGSLREKLVQSDLVECVIGMGEGLFYNSPMPATVIILRARKPTDRKGKILFINAVKEVAREQGQSFLRESHQRRILDVYRGFESVDQFSAVATIEEITRKGSGLAIPLYVTGAKASTAAEEVDLAGAVAGWHEAAATSDAAIADVFALLNAEVNA